MRKVPPFRQLAIKMHDTHRHMLDELVARGYPGEGTLSKRDVIERLVEQAHYRLIATDTHRLEPEISTSKGAP